jgi:microcompartment protein CcmK/EutM
MVLGRVVGTIVSTQKYSTLKGRKLMIVQSLGLDIKEKDAFAVAVDSVGCGIGEIVLCASGSSARQTSSTKDVPVDTVIMAIVDYIEIGDKVVFRKESGQ